MLVRPPVQFPFDKRGLRCWAPLDIAAPNFDLSGINGPARLISGGLVARRGKVGPAGFLQGIQLSSNYMGFPTDAKLPLGTSQRTVSIFFATTQAGTFQPMLCWGTGAAAQAVIFYGGSSANKLGVDSFGTAWNANTTINDGLLHHAAFTYDGTNTVVYLDGVQDGTNAANAFNTTTSGTFSIGHDVAGRFYTGFLANLRIYNRKLSVPEIVMLSKEPILSRSNLEAIALMGTAVSSAHFRRTLSHLGTRTGSRQVHRI